MVFHRRVLGVLRRARPGAGSVGGPFLSGMPVRPLRLRQTPGALSVQMPEAHLPLLNAGTSSGGVKGQHFGLIWSTAVLSLKP